METQPQIHPEFLKDTSSKAYRNYKAVMKYQEACFGAGSKSQVDVLP